MPIITVHENGTVRQINGQVDEPLLSSLIAGGVGVDSSCGGNHRCGKCLVKATGALSAVDETERRLLGEHINTFRLACFAIVRGDCAVTIEPPLKRKVVTEYAQWDIGGEALYTDGFGAAVDIGTTTIAAYLFSPQSTKPLAVAGEYNHQQRYGADVISRIAYSRQNGVGTLSDAVCNQISGMLKQICREAGIPTDKLGTLVVTGNTTMLHFFAGLYAYPLALAPYTPTSLFGDWHRSFIPEFEHASIYLPPCISSYVGADITCGALACRLTEQNGNLLLVDVGTNGEMMLKAGDTLTCCSTAAGPAFEGADISCGSGAIPGAIDKVTMSGGDVRYTTICDEAAETICGSGLIDAAAVYLSKGMIDKSGKLAGERRLKIGDSNVSLNQRDIRQLQLAKSAIRAGMDTLMHECGVDYAQLDQIILCGGFGSYLNPRSAGAIGLIPGACAAKTAAIGNAAGQGAAMILQNESALLKAQEVAEKATTTELSTNTFFLKKFIERMAFSEE